MKNVSTTCIEKNIHPMRPYCYPYKGPINSAGRGLHAMHQNPAASSSPSSLLPRFILLSRLVFDRKRASERWWISSHMAQFTISMEWRLWLCSKKGVKIGNSPPMVASKSIWQMVKCSIDRFWEINLQNGRKFAGDTEFEYISNCLKCMHVLMGRPFISCQSSASSSSICKYKLAILGSLLDTRSSVPSSLTWLVTLGAW